MNDTKDSNVAIAQLKVKISEKSVAGVKEKHNFLKSRAI